MHHALISYTDFETLPEEPEMRFLALESICREKMYTLINQETSEQYDRSVRTEYMTIVAEAAHELTIPDVWVPDNSSDIDAFVEMVTRVVTRLSLRNSGKKDPFSVQLSHRAKTRIRMEVGKLREIILASDLDEKQKTKLEKKLRELEDEIEKPRVNFSRLMAIVAIVSAGTVAGATSFLADAPAAIATITSLVGIDKEAEAQEVERIGVPTTPRQALPAPAKAAIDKKSEPDPKRFGRQGNELRQLDDEIPF